MWKTPLFVGGHIAVHRENFHRPRVIVRLLDVYR